MVGNYLTTLNRPVEQDLQMLRDLGLNWAWGGTEAAADLLVASVPVPQAPEWVV
jgi:biotin synthase-like enzyme